MGPEMRPVALHLFIGGAQRDVRPWHCIPLPFAVLCQYNICFLDVYLVSHEGGLSTKRRKPL